MYLYQYLVRSDIPHKPMIKKKKKIENRNVIIQCTELTLSAEAKELLILQKKKMILVNTRKNSKLKLETENEFDKTEIESDDI